MAKMVSMVVKVSADKIADVLEMLADVADTVTMATAETGETPVAEEEEDETPVTRRPVLARRIAAPVAPVRRVASAPRTRLAGKVIYTPAGTQRQITKMLEDLRGVSSMRALVLRDLAKHPGSSNKEVRERIAAKAKSLGLSVESVDNTIWTMVNAKLLNKESAEA